MTGKPLDPEEVIRAWLAESVPNRAPASLKEALEDATSGPAGNAQPWSRSGGNRFRLAGRIAAAVTIIAIAASGAYLYESGRASSPGQGTVSPSGSPTAAASATSTTGASPSPANTAPQARVTQLPGSNWRLVSGAFPQLVDEWGGYQYRNPVFASTSRGLVAFVPSAAGVMHGYLSDRTVLAAFRTAGPTAPTSWEVHVLRSSDGVSWSEQSVLPSDAATVTGVAESGGRVIAVGYTGDASNATAMVWTTTDLLTWQATRPPVPAQSDTYSWVNGVAAGPAGLLAWGSAGTSTEFWASTDGVAWHRLTSSRLPSDPAPDSLFATPSGYVIHINGDTTSTWESSDGAIWTEAWQGPAWTLGSEGYMLGTIVPASSGAYISFGWAGTPSGGPSALQGDLQLWTSTDLAHWTRSDRVPRPGWTDGFASTPGGYVAAGVQAPGDMGTLPWGSIGIWTSQDGRSWKAAAGLPSLDSIEVIAVVGDGAHVVVTCVDELGNLQLLVGDETPTPSG
jgi:hypothetical protein